MQQMFLHHFVPACTFRPYNSSRVLKLFRTFTGKMTRRLSLLLVFNLLFEKTVFHVVSHIALFLYRDSARHPRRVSELGIMLL